MLGWIRPPSPEERAFIPSRYAELPTLGRLTGRGNTASVETVVAARPDIIFDHGSLGATYRSLADRVQQQTGVPYLLYDGSLSAIPVVYARMGELLGVADRGRELARHAERLLAETGPAGGPGARGAAAGGLPCARSEGARDRRTRLDQRREPGAAGRAPRGRGPCPRPRGRSRSGAGPAWDPAIIIAIDPTFVASVRADPVWRGVRVQRVALLHRGRLARLGPPAEVITRGSLHEVYGVEVTVLEVIRPDGRRARVCIPALGGATGGAPPRG